MARDPATARRSKAPPMIDDPHRKKTIEVDLAWLEEPAPAAEPARPPPLAHAGARHQTIEVAPEWLQVDAEPRAIEPAHRARRSTNPPPSVRPHRATRVLPPPLPREDTPWPTAARAPRR